jgi:predicted  nucleic acid-binding Zn-ribbon protein
VKKSFIAMPIPETSTEKKVEFLMRRAKMLDEKIKRSEKEGDISKEEIKSINNLCQQLIDNSKNDKKIIIQLKDQIHTMKSQIESIVIQNDDKIAKLQSVIFHNNNNKIDDNTIEDIISTRIHQHMDKVVQEVAKTCASEQALFLSKWAERVNYENKSSNNHGLEKDLARLQADHTRLKGRYDALEIVCADLRNSVATRDYESQELQRKALSSFRLEMQSSFDSLMRKLNDNLMTVPKFESMFNDLHQKLEIQQKHNEQAIQKQLVRIFKLEENQIEIQKQMDEQLQKFQVLQEYSGNIAIRVAELDENTAKDLESSFQLSESLKGQIDETLKKSHAELMEHVQSVNLAFNAFQHNVDSMLSQHQEHVDDNFEAFSKNLIKFEKEMSMKSVTHEDVEKQIQDVRNKIESYHKDTESSSVLSKQKIEVISTKFLLFISMLIII